MIINHINFMNYEHIHNSSTKHGYPMRVTATNIRRVMSLNEDKMPDHFIKFNII